MELKLRPHHLLCIQKFVGNGYDGVFAQNLAKIVSYLAAHPETEVTLCEGCDGICATCPDRMNDKCGDGEKVVELDCAVLEACKLNYGDTDAWESLSRTARQEIFETDKFEKICAACEWYGLCKNITD